MVAQANLKLVLDGWEGGLMYLSMRQERKKHGWSQEFVAQQIGVTPETVHYIETGQRKPSYVVLVKLEVLFGLTHRQLFGAANPTPK